MTVLTASHAPESLFVTGLTAGVLSGGGDAVKLVGELLRETGGKLGDGMIPLSPPSDSLAGPSFMDVESRMGRGLGELPVETPIEDDFFLLQPLHNVDFGSLACRRWGDLLELSGE